MSRLCYLAIFVCSLSITAIGCGEPQNEVIQDTRSDAAIQQELDDYEKEMESVPETE